MPCVQVKLGGRVAHLSFAGEFKPGDPPPSGYADWQEWARIQHKAGLRQQQCGDCSLWKFPQEMSDARKEWTAITSPAQPMRVIAPLCKECEKANEQRTA